MPTIQNNLSQAQLKAVDEILRLHWRREPLNISAVRENHPRLLFDVYRIKPFWGWKRAIEAAGLDYKHIKIRLSKSVACKLCGRKMHHLTTHLLNDHGMTGKRYKEKFPGSFLMPENFCARWFGRSQADRTKDAHLIIPHWEPAWTPEYALDRLAELHRMGQPLNPSAIAKHEISLHFWTLRFFRNWDTALLAIGVSPNKARLSATKQNWTRKSVIKALGARSFTRRPLNWSDLVKENKSLGTAARRLFGSYDNALKSAGLNPANIRKTPVRQNTYRTEEQVINAILRRRLMEKPLNDQAMLEGDTKDIALYMKARRFFGTWKASIEAAELNYENINLRTHRYRTSDMVIAELKRRHSLSLPLNSTALKSGAHRDNNLLLRGHHFFTTWQAALKAAGISYQSLFPPKGKYPTAEKIVSEIKRRHNAGIPLNADSMRYGPHPDHALMTKANRTFGSWRKAVEATGINYEKVMKPRRKYPAADDLIKEIRRRHATGLAVNARALSKGDHPDKTLYARSREHFGTWGKALLTAGIKVGRGQPAHDHKQTVVR